MKQVNVGLIGFGTVGTGVVKTLIRNKQLLEKQVGAPVNLKWVADTDLKRDRGVALDSKMFINDGFKVVNDPDVDIVIELVGGCSIAKQFVITALKNGKSVVTANKALLAEHGKEIFSLEQKSKGVIGFEASVAGGIPVVKALREGLVANNILSIYGIINGTANYILTKMTEEQCSFEDTLRTAQELGYAEADPTFDVDGIDSAHKLLLLGSIAAGNIFSMDDVFVEGIREVTEKDIEFAAEFGYIIKLLAIYKKVDGKVQLRVHPTLLPEKNLLSSVRDVYNAVFIKGDIVGNTMYYGRGAGEMPTASAVVADVVDIARGLVNGTLGKRTDFMRSNSAVPVQKMEDIESRYYLRFGVTDQPGVLAHISGILGAKQISISNVYQKERRIGDTVPVIMMTHHASEHAIRQALAEIDRLDEVKDKTLVLRIED